MVGAHNAALVIWDINAAFNLNAIKDSKQESECVFYNVVHLFSFLHRTANIIQGAPNIRAQILVMQIAVIT